MDHPYGFAPNADTNVGVDERGVGRLELHGSGRRQGDVRDAAPRRHSITRLPNGHGDYHDIILQSLISAAPLLRPASRSIGSALI